MRPERVWTGSSRTLAALLLAVVVPPAAMLVWLGVRLVQQDRTLFAQRELERRTTALVASVRVFESSLSGVERFLSDGPLPDGVVRLIFDRHAVDASPLDRVLWLPMPRPLRPADARSFAAAETLEFRGDGDRALTIYLQSAGARDSATRAGALVRAARVLRQQRRWDETLKMYGLLANMRDIEVAGSPADLQARRAVCGVLEDSGRAAARSAAVQGLAADLIASRWRLDRPAWELAAGDVEHGTGHPLTVTADRRLFSTVAEVLWRERDRWPGRALSGRLVVSAGRAFATLVWRTQGDQTTVLAISPAVVQAWSTRAVESTPMSGDRLSVIVPAGQALKGGGAAVRAPVDATVPRAAMWAGDVIAGGAPATDGSAIRLTAADTGLPWMIVLSPGPSSPLAAEFAARRRLLWVGLVAILVFLAGGSHLLWRVVRRELAVVRQQQEFVAAVSHEFRTPLTSLRHTTELLQESDDVPRDRRTAFYESLGRNTDRLQRLVESLLDFSRMEGGKKRYDRQPVDAAGLAERLVAGYRQEVGSRGVNVDLAVEDSGPMSVSGDAAALTSALWNLLDNAVKYSPDARQIHVTVARRGAHIAIAVRDEGLGIPPRERKDIFRRFVRGEQATRLGIQGTGLGLAIVSHVVSAHDGTIEVESEEGAGSTFRVLLPALE
jgi:signal transduction histidine kinase